MNVISSSFSFELTSEEIEEKNWNTIEVSHYLGSEPIEIQHTVFYAGFPEECIPLCELTEELKEDGISYEDIVSFVKSKINQLTTAHLSRCF